MRVAAVVGGKTEDWGGRQPSPGFWVVTGGTVVAATGLTLFLRRIGWI